MSVLRIGHGVSKLLGVSWKADANDRILLTQPENMLKYFTAACRLYQPHVLKDQIEIEIQKACQSSRASDTDDIDHSGAEHCVHCTVEAVIICVLQGVTDFF